MDPISWILEHCEKIGIVTLALVVSMGLLVALLKPEPWLVTGKEYRRALAANAAELQRVVEGCKFEREMNRQLLTELQRAVSVTDVIVKRRGAPRGIDARRSNDEQG
jgi:hypothetical protein